jgi:hypothetical protein
MAKAKKTFPKTKKKRPEWDADPAVPDVPPAIDLSKEKSENRWGAALAEWENKHQKRRPKTPNSHEPYFYHTDIVRFLKTMERSPISVREHMILRGTGSYFVLRDKRIHFVAYQQRDITTPLKLQDKRNTPSGVLLTTCDVRHKDNKGFTNIVLVNGDEDSQYLNDLREIVECGFPTISFACLRRFYSKGDAIQRVIDNKLRVLDYTPDQTRPLTAAQKRSLKGSKAVELQRKKQLAYEKKIEKLTPPEFGFSLVGQRGSEQWHRSGFVLFADTEHASTKAVGAGLMHIILGIDEDTYFGCELPCECDTVEEALLSLTPESLQGRKDIVRQGEWFIVPVKASEVPEEKDSLLLFESNGDDWSDEEGIVFMPIDDIDSNRHWLHGEGRVSKDGKLFVRDPVLMHEEHEEASVVGWATFEKNIAVRSFSEQGVD